MNLRLLHNVRERVVAATTDLFSRVPFPLSDTLSYAPDPFPNIVGQFWRLTGGNDAAVKDPATFVDFDEPGFVKSAIDFVLVPHGSGTRLTTNTCNRATDESTARSFRNYWRVIGLGSKLIRLDMLRAVRRRAESIIETS